MHKFLKGIKNKKEQLRPEALSFFIWKNVDEADRIITCFFYTAYFFPVTLLITQHSLHFSVSLTVSFCFLLAFFPLSEWLAANK